MNENTAAFIAHHSSESLDSRGSLMDVLRLFLIEDDDDIALLIRKSLERVNHVVTRCRTAADALIVLAQSTFDLVLLDQRLPDMEGLELLRTLAREGIAAPVLMVTAWGDEHLAIRALKAGALDYVPKYPALSFLAELPKRVAESVRRYRLEQSNCLLIQALESTRDAIMITDLQGEIINVNRALEDFTGYTRHELIGQTPRLFRSGIHPPGFYKHMWQTVLSRSCWQGELTNRCKDGSLLQTSMTISPIVDSQGRLTHFVGIQRDISEHKRLEQQLIQAQKMQSIGTLAGGVAHEFNNLLAGINGYAALGLREPGLTPTLREFLQNVVDLSERAAGLTRQLLAFARKPALVRQRTSLPDLLRSTAELVTRTLHIDVALEIPPPGDALLVEADSNQLQQALVNLALNARDAMLCRTDAGDTPGVPGSITFRLRPIVMTTERPAFPQRVPPGDYLLVEVQDQGSGMSQEVLSQALDPFYTTKEVGQGTGLGLPMVFGIVQGHQGFLTIDSEPGKGTCVGLYLVRMVDRPGSSLPGSRILNDPGVQLGDPDVLESEHSPGRSILVIDDEEAVLDVVRRFLEIDGHRVECVTTGQEAVDRFASGRMFDLVVLDLMMPREDPAVTFQRIRQRCPGVPILLCTGLAEAEPAPRLLKQPATSLIRKPFRMNALWYAVKRAFIDKRDGEGGALIVASS
jgi:PAS domain S-box-containing protein